MDVVAMIRELAAGPPLASSASVNLRPRGASPTYQVHQHWSLNLYDMPGLIRLPLRGSEHRLTAGTVCLMPPGTRRQFVTQQPGTQWVVHFQPEQSPAEPGLGLIDGRGSQRELRFLADAVLACADARPRSAVVWHLLWLVAEIAGCQQQTSTGHALVDRAGAFIRRHLARPIAIAEVAAAVGCSHNHLTRLFRQHTGQTVVAWLRSERMRQAQALLLQTDLPIAEVGAEVGIADPQLFNKTVRRHFGRAPSRLRKA